MTRFLRQQVRRGFTLIETVIVLAISVLMFMALTFLIYTFNNTSAYEQTLSQSSGSASAVVRDVESLTLPADAVLQTYAFSNATYTSSSTVLVLEIPSIDSSGNVIPNTYDYAAVYSVGTNAYRLLQSNALSSRVSGTKLLSSTVSALTFSYNSADFASVSTTTVDVQTRAQERQNLLTDHERETMSLRNH